jgi:transcriptional regulator with XRE-family HTH domain
VTNTYRAITGRRYDLDALSPDEREFLRNVMAFYRTKPDWAEFTAEWIARARRTLWKGKRVPVGAPVYRICQDLAARLGIAEGKVSPPDYRDRIADLIESRFRSRYEFCKKTGIDEGHLSRVLGSKRHLAPETLFKVLEVLNVEIELVEREEVYEHAAQPLDPETPLERLSDVQRRLDRLLNLKAKAEHVSPGERARLLGNRGPFADDVLDPLRVQVEGGEAFDVVLGQALLQALDERARLARTVATEAESARQLAAS